jgi:hypothetical protein
MYLLGRDEGQWWLARVPSTVGSVHEALAALTPAAVRRAVEKGRAVRRQGDVWFIRGRRANYDAIRRGRHQVEETTTGATITHPEHAPLVLEGAWTAHMQRSDVGARASAGD